MIKLLLALVAPLILAVLLTGCGETNGESKNETYGIVSNPHHVNLPDGRKVLCVYEKTDQSSRSGGPSCDWDNAK